MNGMNEVRRRLNDNSRGDGCRNDDGLSLSGRTKGEEEEEEEKEGEGERGVVAEEGERQRKRERGREEERKQAGCKPSENKKAVDGSRTANERETARGDHGGEREGTSHAIIHPSNALSY